MTDLISVARQASSPLLPLPGCPTISPIPILPVSVLTMLTKRLYEIMIAHAFGPIPEGAGKSQARALLALPEVGGLHVQEVEGVVIRFCVFSLNLKRKK